MVTTNMRLPLTTDGITAEWLSEALRHRHPGVTVERVRIRDIITGTSTKIRITVDYAASGQASELPRSLIVKGGFEEHSRWMGMMYASEARFYRDVAPRLDMNVPACFYAGSDPDSHQSIVVLEDLRERNVVFQQPQHPSTYAQLARRLEAMARYHAQTWNSPEFEPGGAFDQVTTRHEGFGKIFFARYLEPERWAHFMRQPRAAAVSTRLHDRDWMERAFATLAQLHKTRPSCVVHGDTHLGNLYLEPDGTPGFLDAQIARAPWQTDVNYHLIAACDLADRPLWERPLLAHYLAALRSHGVDAPDFADAWDDYRRETVQGYFIFVINESHFQTEAVNTAAAARFGAAALDHDVIRLLP